MSAIQTGGGYRVEGAFQEFPDEQSRPANHLWVVTYLDDRNCDALVIDSRCPESHADDTLSTSITSIARGDGPGHGRASLFQ